MSKRTKQRQRSKGTNPTEATAENEPLRALDFDWRDHIGALLGLAALLLIAIRIWSISGNRPETAFGLIQESGAANAGLGLTISFLPVGLMLCYAIAYTLVLARVLRRPDTTPWREIVLLAIGALAASGLSTTISLFAIVSGTISGVTLRTYGKEVRNGLIWVYSLACLAGFAGTVSDPWHPSERIDPADGRPFTAYVLSEQNGELAMLREQPREIIRIDSARIEDRKICEGPQDEWDLLWWRLGSADEQANYPACPPR